jgi:glycerophosphoryl diester phosphodiesterase
MLTDMISATFAPTNMQTTTREPEIIAHRGVRDRYPENSLPAFLDAIAEGVDAIELDVHATRDGVVVVHHEPLLPKQPDSPLAGRKISAISASELAEFELTAGVHVPTLKDVLDTVTPQVGVYVEIKAPDLEALVADLLATLPVGSAKCSVHSFDHRIARKFGSLAPHVPTGILEVAYPVDPVSVLHAAGARDLWQQCDFIDDELVTAIHEADGRVIAWTCNDVTEWRRLRELGVDGICTDRPAAYREACRLG